MPVSASSAEPEEDLHHSDSPYEAAEYFRQQRVLDDKPVPAERYLSAWQHIRVMPQFSLRANRFLAPGTPAATFGTWESLGPGNVGGRTRGLLIHPQNPRIMWAGGATGGIWKTTDGGATWVPQTDFLPALVLNSLAIDPNNPDVLYAGTGEQTQNWRGAGIFKTTDGGTAWTQLPATTGPDFYFVNKIAVSASTGQVYAATDSGVWASADGGGTWRQSMAAGLGGPNTTSNGGLNSGCYDLALAPRPTTDTVFAVCHPTLGSLYSVFRNLDAAGTTIWAPVLSDPQMWYTALAVAPSQPSTVYAISVTNATGTYSRALLAVYRSLSNGDPGTWETRTSNQNSSRLNTAILSIDAAYSFPSFCNASAPDLTGQDGYNLSVAVDPLDPNRVWAAGIGLFRSDDGGANWGYAFSGAHPDQHVFAFDPGYDGAGNQTLYVGNDGGVYKTTRARGTIATCSTPSSNLSWTAVNNSYGTTQFYHGVPYPGGGAYFGGTQDNGTVRGSDARGANLWNSIFGGDGGVSRIDPLNPTTVYIEYVHGAMYKSVDGGSTYVLATGGITEPSANFLFIAWYTFDPNNTLRLYVGATQLWRTEDGMNTWTAASAPIPTVAGVMDKIAAIAVSPADPNLVLFGTNHGYICRNPKAPAATGTTVWNATLPRAGNVSHLEFDPLQPATVYATYTTFNANPGDNHVYRSTDGGVTWTGIDGGGNGGLPDVPVETLLVDPDDSARLYIGTDLGVFASLDGGGTWVRDDQPFANVITKNLVIDRTGGAKTLYAFTYGRGVWRVPLPGGNSPGNCAYSVSPNNITADATGGTYTLNVTTSANCPWAVFPVTTASLASVQAPGSGAGSGQAFLTVNPNTGTATRSASLLVQNQVVTVIQPGATGAVVGDEISRAYAIPSLPNQTFGSNTGLTANPADPQHSCTGSTDFRTGWLRFTAPADGYVQASIIGLRLDTGSGNSGIVVSAYPLTGSAIGGELACVKVPKDSNPTRIPAAITFPVKQGTAYAVEVASLSTGASSDNAQLYMGVATSGPPPGITVTPVNAAVDAGQARQFTANVANVPNPAVRWTVTPQVGVVSAGGLYTAPAQLDAPVTFTLTAQSFGNPSLAAASLVTVQPPPQVSLGPVALTNAADYRVAPVAPGEVVTLFGSGIGPDTLAPAALDSQGRLAATLAGTQVLFDGIAAPLVYVSAGQSAAIVPYEVAGQTTTQLTVVRNGRSSTPLAVPVGAVAPALFTANASGTGQAAAVNQDNTLNGPTPAPRGSIVAVFGTGEGQTGPGGVDGLIATSVLPKPLAPVKVQVGGVEAELKYDGAAPLETAGVIQINFVVPASVPPGPNAVVVTIGGVSSQAGVTIMVQ